MTGETDLKTLLSSCEAMMADDEYVFACVEKIGKYLWAYRQ